MRFRALATAVTGLVILSNAVGSPTLAHAAAPGGAQLVTLELAPTDSVALDRLAHAHLPAAQRRAALAAVLPTDLERDSVRSALTARGYRVVGETALGMTVSAPAARVRADFGSARAQRPGLPVAQGLPTMPAALRGKVLAAFGGDETRPAELARDTYPSYSGVDGTRLRAAYRGVSGVPAQASRQVIATVQLSGWYASDLSTYAAAEGVPDPLATGQFTAVDAGRTAAYQSASSSCVPGGDGTGNVEVALDQETLLATDPYAAQRAYFGCNTDQGFVQAVQQVATDAAAGWPITALSISWGGCEQWQSSQLLSSMQTALSYVLAAGVTVFAATGDSGVADCYVSGDSSSLFPAVDFPASSPLVVAVGGTTLDDLSSPLSESAWSGGGGGFSTLYDRPAWQPGVSPLSSVLDCKRLTSCREVPDITSDGNPDTGLATYITGYGWMMIGGTSLAAPTQAALLTGALAADGYSGGVGDIHPALYSASGGDFRDIVSGSNTLSTLTGYVAGTGFDLVSGRGAPLWSALVGSLAAPHALAATAALSASTTSAHAGQTRPLGTGSFTALGATSYYTPVVATGHGLTYLVDTGTDHQLYVRTPATAWAQLGPSGTYCEQAGAAVVGDVLYVACEGGDGALYASGATVPATGLPKLHAWHSLGGVLGSGPAVGLVAGQVQFVVTGTNGYVYARTWRSGYSRLPYACTGTPALASWGSRAVFACVGWNHELYYAAHASSGWPAAIAGGGRLVGTPGVVVAPSGLATAVGEGGDGRLYDSTLGSGTWTPLGGSLAGGAAVAETVG